jgi:hypothetical protein
VTPSPLPLVTEETGAVSPATWAVEEQALVVTVDFYAVTVGVYAVIVELYAVTVELYAVSLPLVFLVAVVPPASFERPLQASRPLTILCKCLACKATASPAPQQACLEPRLLSVRPSSSPCLQGLASCQRWSCPSVSARVPGWWFPL